MKNSILSFVVAKLAAIGLWHLLQLDLMVTFFAFIVKFET